MSSFEKCKKEGHPIFSYDKDSNKQFWMITAPPDCDLAQLSSVKIDFDSTDPLLVIGKFKIGEKKYCIKENRQVNSNQFLTLLPKKKHLKIAKQFVRNLIISEEFSFENEIPLNSFFPKEIVPPAQKSGLKIQVKPSGYVAPQKKRKTK